MSAEPSHSRIIARAAKDALEPIGCFRKGRSRTWLDDRGWWVGVTEFQPSGWSRGSYLNVGACWLWYAKDYLSFDEGYRVEGFHAFRSEEQFEEVALALAERAKREVAALRGRFPSLDAAARHLRAKETSDKDIWGHYNAGVSAGMAGDLGTARQRLQAVLAMEERDLLWVAELKERTAALVSAAGDASRFRAATAAIAEQARALLKLPEARISMGR